MANYRPDTKELRVREEIVELLTKTAGLVNSNDIPGVFDSIGILGMIIEKLSPIVLKMVHKDRELLVPALNATEEAAGKFQELEHQLQLIAEVENAQDVSDDETPPIAGFEFRSNPSNN